LRRTLSEIRERTETFGFRFSIGLPKCSSILNPRQQCDSSKLLNSLSMRDDPTVLQHLKQMESTEPSSLCLWGKSGLFKVTTETPLMEQTRIGDKG
jgi:hypothetical protein